MMFIVAVLALAATSSAQPVPQPELSGLDANVVTAIEAARGQVVETPSDGANWGDYGMILEAHGLIVPAGSAYERAAELDPGNVRWPYFRAMLLSSEDPAAASGWFERAAATLSNYAPLYIRWGETVEKLGREQEAAGLYKRAAVLDPQNALGHFGLGRLALRRGQVGEAIALLERARRFAPASQAIAATLARAYHQAGRRDEAQSLIAAARGFSRTLKHRDPLRAEISARAVDVGGFLRRARMSLDSGQAEAALKVLDELRKLDPENPSAWLMTASAHELQGRPTDAAAAAERALGRASGEQRVDATAMLASNWWKIGRFQDADRLAGKVLEVRPGHFHMLVLRALAAARRGDVAALLPALDKAFAARDHQRELRAVLESVLVELADGLAAVGDFEGAVLRAEQALEMAVEAGAPAVVEERKHALAAYRAGRRP